MDRETRNAIERFTRRARKLLEEDFAPDFEGGPLREAALAELTRFVALKMLEARELTAALPPEIRALFDWRDQSTLRGPGQVTVVELLALIDAPELGEVWKEDETLGWVYQFFSSGEERRTMRDQSPAPRNGRELAVRNQFFTPRYVVEFLTDNTLGRIWFEMRGGDTLLAERCAYLVRDKEAGAAREKKDPRDLRILDPACGSGHFLVYAFDLLVLIYEEAWNDGRSGEARFSRSETSLAEDHPTIGDLRRALPTLILKHNLHGVEVDPRCAQVARLALWMRAERCFADLGVDREERGLIRRMNIVTAEPMPGDTESQVAFARGLRPAGLGDRFLDLVDRMRLAGELGSLLKIEDTDPAVMAAARSFARGADAASHGATLLEILRERFDVVLMNPPFGAGSVIAKQAFERAYPRTKNDLYAAFVERGIELLCAGGRLGALTSRSGFFLSTFQVWREEIVLGGAPPAVFADLGHGVLDNAMVEVAAYCLGGAAEKTVVLRAVEAEDKAAALLGMIRDPEAARGNLRFEVPRGGFASLPGSPFAYWASEQVRGVFRAFPPFATGKNTVKQGLASGDDLRFMRLWWEVDASRCGVDRTWVTVSKGGDARPFYADLPLVLGYSRAEQTGIQQIGRFGRGATHYYLPGLTYALRARRFCPQVLPAGAITTVRGSGIYAFPDPAPFLALLNASVVDFLLKLMLGRGGHPQFDMGDIAQVPVPVLPAEAREALARMATRAWSLRRSLDTRNEVSHAFTGPALLQCEGKTLAERAAVWARRVSATTAELGAIQAEIDAQGFDLYGIGEADRRSITAGFGSGAAATGALDADAASEGDVDADDAEDAVADTLEALTAELVSWAVGVAFGRFDVRLATGARPFPPEPAPFDALPVCSPAMLASDDGLPLSSPPDGYPLLLRPGGILVDDARHPLDLTTAVRAVFTVVFGEAADDRWNEAAAALAPRERDLRNWLSRGFFEHHLKQYSRSRRKAPIFWQLGTAQSGYAVWVDAHRVHDDTFFQVQNNLVVPKIFHEERMQTTLEQEAASSPPPARRKELAAQGTLLEELRTLLDEVKRVAPLWRPHLDDGVVLTMAPLFRLVPQHKAWQKELKAGWDGLAEGKLDWAHLAMHLWPERVVPKCATARALAIAHGLEDVFWDEATPGKWTARLTLTRPVDELVRERTSPAVKASLRSLVEAPIVGGGATKRGRKASAP